MIGIPDAWTEFGGTDPGTGTSVAVLDTGVDDSHEDLAVTKWSEFDSDGNPVDSDPNDADGHGTHVAGTVGGAQDPAGGGPAYGVAPEADIYGVKVLADDGTGDFSQILAGMEWSLEQDVDIIQMSLGGQDIFGQFIEPVRNANEAGAVVIASAGNNGEGSSSSPGNVFESISVGAVDSNQNVADFSSGEVVDPDDTWTNPPADWPDEYIVPDFTAPGVDIESAATGTTSGTDDEYSGTSMAAPHVAGSSALLLQNNPQLKPDEIYEAFEETTFAGSGEQDTATDMESSTPTKQSKSANRMDT